MDAGLPTCIAVQIMVAVGTSHGLVLVFDSSQTLRSCLDSQDKDQGSVRFALNGSNKNLKCVTIYIILAIFKYIYFF